MRRFGWCQALQVDGVQPSIEGGVGLGFGDIQFSMERMEWLWGVSGPVVGDIQPSMVGMELLWDGFRPVGCRLATYRQPSKVYWWMHGFGVVPGPVSRRHTAQYEGD